MWYKVPGATLCGTMIFSLGSPGINMVESPFVTSRPSGAIVACFIRNLISLFISPAFVVGTFPEIRWDLAAQQKSLLFCACNHAARLKNVVSGWIGPHLVAGSRTVSDMSEMNLCIAQWSVSHSEGCLLWWSQIWLRSYLPLRCFTEIGILLIFERNLFILEDAENFPFLISSMAC